MLHENLHEILFQVSASQDLTHDGMGQSVALIDGHCMGDLVPIIHDSNSGTIRGTQGQHSMMVMYISRVWKIWNVI